MNKLPTLQERLEAARREIERLNSLNDVVVIDSKQLTEEEYKMFNS